MHACMVRSLLWVLISQSYHLQAVANLASTRHLNVWVRGRQNLYHFCLTSVEVGNCGVMLHGLRSHFMLMFDAARHTLCPESCTDVESAINRYDTHPKSEVLSQQMCSARSLQVTDRDRTGLVNALPLWPQGQRTSIFTQVRRRNRISIGISTSPCGALAGRRDWHISQLLEDDGDRQDAHSTAHR